MATSPLKQAGDLVTYSITSNGTDVSGKYPPFDISITKSLNKIASAVFHIQDGDLATLEFPATNSEAFEPGTPIEISLGYNSTNSVVFSGIVTGQKVNINSGGPVLEVTCKDQAVKMTSVNNNNSFVDMKDSDIIDQIISDAGLNPTVDATSATLKELVQHNTTDWDFIMTRAELNGMVIIADQGNINVVKPKLDASPVISLTYGVDIIDFQATLNATSQLSAVTSRSWDPSTQSVVESTGEAPSGTLQGNLSSTDLSTVMGANYQLYSAGPVEEAGLKTCASSHLLKSVLSRVIGSISFTGYGNIKPGDLVEVAGVSDRFNGNSFVSGVSHSVSDGEWTTSLEIGLEEEWFSQKPNQKTTGTGGNNSTVSGLMCGKVKQLDQDPNGEYRILLTFPLMPQSSEGVWARLSTFYATNGKGVFFIPEIGDEVIAGFLDNDSKFPIVLGSLYSSAIKSPNELTAENYTKAIITNSGCKISFDDENKVITFSTPGNNQTVYSDEDKSIVITDQNNNKITMNSDGISIQDKSNNKITMSSSGIEINSASDMKLVASGNIQIKPGANAQISAGADVSLAGVNISASANATLKAAGTASTEVSSSGTTAVKGTMVMIN